MSVDVVDGTDVHKILEYERQGLRGVIPNPEPAKLMQTRHVGAFSQDVLDAERRAQMMQARATIRGDMEGRIATGTSDWASQQKQFREAQRISPDSAAMSELVESTADNFGVAVVKRGTRDVLDSRARLGTLEILGARTTQGKRNLGDLAPDIRAKAQAELENLDVAWADQGVKEQAGIAKRVKANREKLARIQTRQEQLAKEASEIRTLKKPDAQDAEAGAARETTGEALQVERGRLKMLRREMAQLVEDDEALLAGKYKDKPSYVRESVLDKIADEKLLQKNLGAKIDDFKFALRDEADSIQEKIDLLSGQERFRAKQGRADLARARGKSLSAMEMNTEMAVLHEAEKRGGLALDALPPEFRERILGRQGVKVHFFKKDDWEAVERFWKHWSHADDWGDNKIVSALRTMRTVWAPYVAANGFGMMTRMRDAVSNHLMYEIGGAWASVPSRIRSYIHSHKFVNAWRKVVDKAMTPEEFGALTFKAASGQTYSYAELLQFAQSRGIIGAPGM